MKGIEYPYAADSLPAPSDLGTNQVYMEELVYEMHPTSSLTGETKTFHFALATGRYKDNRIPPKGFRIDAAPARLAEPVWNGEPNVSYFAPEEYAGGYDQVALNIPPFPGLTTRTCRW